MVQGKTNEKYLLFCYEIPFTFWLNVILSVSRGLEWKGDKARKELSDLLNGTEALLSDSAMFPSGLRPL